MHNTFLHLLVQAVYRAVRMDLCDWQRSASIGSNNDEELALSTCGWMLMTSVPILWMGQRNPAPVDS